MRTHDLTWRQLQRIALSQTVPCRPRASRRGCGAPAGQPCTSLATGLPLAGLGAHVDRLADAQAAAARSRRSARRAPTVAPEPASRLLATA